MFRNRLEFNVLNSFKYKCWEPNVSQSLGVQCILVFFFLLFLSVPHSLSARPKPCHIKGGCQNCGPLLGTLVIIR